MSDRWSASRPVGDVDWSDEEDTSVELPVGYLPDGLVTIRYLWDAVRRHVRLWVTIALAGLLVGALTHVVLPPPNVAATKLLLTHAPGDDPLQAVATDVQLAHTRTVADRVIDRVGLDEPVVELLERYEVTQVTDRVVEITVEAPSNAEAKLVADVIAATFLEFRLQQVRVQRRPIKADLSTAQAGLDRLREQLAEPVREGDPAALARIGRAEEKVAGLRQRLGEQQAAVTAVGTSKVLDPAAVVPPSRLKDLALDVATGLAGGLVLGLGLVVLRALVSDRVWRRRAIAESLGARVVLTPSLLGRRTWWRLLPRRLTSHRRADLEQERQRATRYVRGLLSVAQGGTPTVTFVAVSDERAAASLVADVVAQLAGTEGKVLAADLSGRRWLARELASEADTDVDVYAPGATDRQPAGFALPDDEDTTADLDGLGDSWDRADLVVAFTDVSFQRGLDHLRSWSAQAVAVVSAGACTATRLRTTGELLELAGVHLVSAIVLGGDRTDETAGVPVDVPAPAVAASQWTRAR